MRKPTGSSRRRAGLPVVDGGQRRRQARRTNRDAWRTSAGAIVVAVDLKHQAELGRLLAGAGGYVVRTAEGKQLGHVDHVRYREHADRPDLIAVRRRWFWQRPTLLSFETVAAVDPQAHTVTLRPASSGADRGGEPVTLFPSRRLLRRGLEVEMFKRRKQTSGAGRPAKIGSLIAAVGGLLSGLLFWRKRKAG